MCWSRRALHRHSSCIAPGLCVAHNAEGQLHPDSDEERRRHWFPRLRLDTPVLTPPVYRRTHRQTAFSLPVTRRVPHGGEEKNSLVCAAHALQTHTWRMLHISKPKPQAHFTGMQKCTTKKRMDSPAGSDLTRYRGEQGEFKRWRIKHVTRQNKTRKKKEMITVRHKERECRYWGGLVLIHCRACDDRCVFFSPVQLCAFSPISQTFSVFFRCALMSVCVSQSVALRLSICVQNYWFYFLHFLLVLWCCYAAFPPTRLLFLSAIPCLMFLR